MAVTLVFKMTRAAIGSVELDASVSEVHTADAEITEHPVEAGANISDHIRQKPDTLTMEGLVSNTPLPAPSSDLTFRRTAGSVQFDSRSELEPARAGTAYRDLLSIKESGTLVTVVTALRVYERMAIKNLSVPRDVKTGQAVRFTAQLVQVLTVESKTVTVDLVSAKKKVSLGKKAAPTTPAPIRAKSVLLGIVNRGLEAVGASPVSAAP